MKFLDVRSTLLVFMILSPLFASLFRVWVHQDAVQLGYALSEQTREQRRLDDELKKLEVEWAAERAPDRLKVLASRLGMAPASPSQLLGVAP